MLFLRSLLFNIAFYVALVVMMIVGLPTLVLRRWVIRYAQLWGRVSVWLLRVIAGTRLEVRGLENRPAGGFLVAAKHQSALETFALLTMLDDPVYVLKRELMWLPFFGWYLKFSGMVPIDRSAGARAFPRMNARALVEVSSGRQLIIFPEGTRRPVAAPPAYKLGVAHIYRNLGVPCVPVALNTGLFWPRRQFWRRPGTVVIEFLDPIPPGLPKEEFFALVEARIEAASDALVAEAQGPRVTTSAAA